MKRLFTILLGIVLAIVVAILGYTFMNKDNLDTNSNASPVATAQTTPNPNGLEDTDTPIVMESTPVVNVLNSNSLSDASIGNGTVEQAVISNNNSVETVNNQSVYSTGLPADKQDPEKLAQRRNVYLSLNEMLDALSLGEAPDVDQVHSISQELVRLTNEGYIPVEDAINTFDFMRKALPGMDIPLNEYIEQLNP